MSRRSIGLLLTFSLCCSPAWAQLFSTSQSSGWPGAASSITKEKASRFGIQEARYPTERQGLRLWEFRFSDERAPLIKNGSLELDFEGDGLSLKARF